jgi:hypothetical protein
MCSESMYQHEEAFPEAVENPPQPSQLLNIPLQHNYNKPLLSNGYDVRLLPLETWIS